MNVEAYFLKALRSQAWHVDLEFCPAVRHRFIPEALTTYRAHDAAVILSVFVLFSSHISTYFETLTVPGQWLRSLASGAFETPGSIEGSNMLCYEPAQDCYYTHF